MVPPNGLPISRAPSGAERHTARNHILKCARSRSATRVGCMGLLGGLLPSIAPESHAPTTPRNVSSSLRQLGSEFKEDTVGSHRPCLIALDRAPGKAAPLLAPKRLVG